MKKGIPWKKTKTAAFYLAMRIILGMVIVTSCIAAIYIGRKPYGEELKEGDVSLRTIYAPIDFKYRVGIDEEKTELARKKAKDAVNDIYEIDMEISRRQIKKLEEFFQQLIPMQNLAEKERSEKLEKMRALLPLDLSSSDLKTLLDSPKLGEVQAKTGDLLQSLLFKGIITNELGRKFSRSPQKNITLINPKLRLEQKLPVKKLLTLEKVKKNLSSYVQDLFPENRKLRIAVINLLSKALKANLKFNRELTEKRREQAFAATPIQYKEKEVKKEELIITRGERVTKEHLLKIKEMFRRQIKVNRFMFFSGATILSLIFLVIITIYLKTYEPKIFLSMRKLILVSILFILILGLAKLIADYSSLPSYAIPTTIASLLLAMLLGPRLAIIITIALSIFVGIIAGDQLNVTTVSFIGGIVGIFSIQGVRRRSQILLTGCLVSMANFASICALGLLQGLEYSVFLKDQGFWGLVNGVGSAIIVAGILPVFEYFFNIVTNISLLELSDLNHPLLKEMVLKAPGTYHHSLIVGNLSEAACDAIGANSLLARVGSYFHDIGKTEKAEYFSENQVGIAKKKHDKLTPSMSSLIITNHVKDGVELARKYKLNQAIVDFIAQHHGTSLIYYFYQRALEKVEDDQMLKEEGFRYPGPKPQSKETAVTLLADSVEAASRALSEPTPARIKALARKIINNKFIDNQLDECELTLKDLEVIADAFSHILMGIFHSRVEYEQAKERPKNNNKNKRPPEKGAHK